MNTIKVGTTFKPRGKHPQLTTVVDVLTTRNIVGDVVKIEYLCEHLFLGQVVKSRHCKTTILRGFIG